MPDPIPPNLRYLFPVCLAAAILVAGMPALHPYGTCADWLVMWGDASRNPTWRLIHEMAMAGFALIGAIGALYPLLGPRTMTSVMGGASLIGGGAISAIGILIHATSISSLGRAFTAAGSEADKKMIKTVAEAFLAYDGPAVSTSSMLVTVGFCLVVVSLYQERILSRIPALLFFGLSLTWTFQYHGTFNRFGFSVPERIHWGSLSVLLAGLGFVFFLGGRSSERRAESPISLAPPAAAATTAD